MLHHSPAPLWALRATHAHVLSARPDAPVVDEGVRAHRTTHRPAGLDGLRDSAAGLLRRVAGWVEPQPARPSGMIGCQTR